MIKQNPCPLSLSKLGDIKKKPHKVDELAAYNDHEVVVRGFVYEAPDGRWLLASKPDLKSCCVGAEHEIGNQIVLETSNAKFPLNQVVTVTGKFHIDPQWDKEGHCKQMYCMKEATIVATVSQNTTLGISILILVIGLLAIGLYYLRRFFNGRIKSP